jgi:ornithine cyclodeaminase/alanine dehydrogenase
MKKVEFLFLSRQNVIGTGVTIKEAISTAEDVLREHGRKNYENPPKPAIHTRPGTFIHAMPGYLPKKHLAGMKWVSGYPKNSQADLPTVMGLIVLNDILTGEPMLVMDCSYVTALRTSAVSAVSTKYLARRDAKTVGIIGFGIQGQCHVIALKEVMPSLERILVHTNRPETVANFKKRYGSTINFRIEVMDNPRDAIEPADVIVTATGKLDKPIFMESWVKRGALVLPVHMYGWQSQMFKKADKFILDDWSQYGEAFGKPGMLYHPLPKCHAELGEILLGGKVGRENASERIVSINYGIVIHDIALAAVVFEKAMENHIGTWKVLMEGDFPVIQ